MGYQTGNYSNYSLQTNTSEEYSFIKDDQVAELEWFWPLLWTIASITTVDNFIVIFLVISRKKLHTNTNWFILSLSCADFIIGCVAAPMDYVVFKVLPENELSDVVLFLENMLFDISAVNLCLVAFDRYLAVVYPLKYVTFLTHRRVCGLIVLAWLVPALFFVGQILVLFTSKTYLSQEISSSVLVVLFQILPMIYLLVTFIHIAYIVRKHLRKINKENEQIKFNRTIPRTALRQTTRYRSILALMAAVNGTFVLCCGISVYDFFCRKLSLVIPPQYIAMNMILLNFNSVVNPIMYGILKSDFQREMKRLVVCLECRRPVRNSQMVSIGLTNVNSLRNDGLKEG
ncbi:trace amine-associated receptor 4-like [Actinia tenebrosa]|uniref:Trace amine-associated receptor 4-like n=1 Tax=Actinia tenebrosa TaxID=6105 RepID=A0A6P8I8P0_ACTTE|nr:trace amine-associated receptor 4-like [Actinia tenebrosa]